MKGGVAIAFVYEIRVSTICSEIEMEKNYNIINKFYLLLLYQWPSSICYCCMHHFLKMCLQVLPCFIL